MYVSNIIWSKKTTPFIFFFLIGDIEVECADTWGIWDTGTGAAGTGKVLL